MTVANDLARIVSRLDVLDERVSELENDHSECGYALGQAQGELAMLQASSDVQVAEQMAARVAWYEDKTRLVLAAVQSGTTGQPPKAEGIHCERCHRQVAETDVVQHLVAHTTEEFENWSSKPKVKGKKK